MIDERKTLGDLLSDPLIAKIAPDATYTLSLRQMILKESMTNCCP